MNRSHCGERQTGRADLGALAVAAARPERSIQGVDDGPGAAGAFHLAVREHGQVRKFRPGEQVGRAVGTSATQAPQPMQAAKSRASSASSWPTRKSSASGAVPAMMSTCPPARMMESRAARSTTRSRTTGKAADRSGSIRSFVMPPKARRCCRHDGVFGTGPWGTSFTVTPHAPHTPSRQSDSNEMGSRPCSASWSFNRSSSSRRLISGVASVTTWVSNRPSDVGPSCRQISSSTLIGSSSPAV